MTESISGPLHIYNEVGTEGGRWAIQDMGSIDGDQWLPEGLHIIVAGDMLTVFDKVTPQDVVWTGLVSLNPNGVRRRDRYARTDPVGVDLDLWASWFVEEYQGLVVPKGTIKK